MSDSLLVDPLGRTITLHDRTWFGHILKAHPEIAAARTMVESVIRAPREIRFSRSGKNSRLYFGSGASESNIMMVVVDISLGLVKTAHRARKITGGEVEWSRLNP